MHRYAIRIFAEDLVGWVPLVCVVTMTSTLVGICVSQAVWTSGPAFAEATRAARLDLTGFQVVSVTIYAEVALIALFALTAIGSATVRRCHSTFAQWRLAGATPIQVRVSALSVAGLASTIGSAAGSLASLPLSSALVPAFDALAAEGFSGGLGSFEPPAFDVGALAAPLAFAVSWPTRMAGAILPALRTGRVAPSTSCARRELIRAAPARERRQDECFRASFLDSPWPSWPWAHSWAATGWGPS